ncbi:tetratricopeptide repeat protein, partial [bacterium]|nr:tetratricopeptide repeat protein [bacterium]
EIKYLKLASLAHLGKWSELESLFADITYESPFHIYSSFKIYTLLENSDIQSTLKTQVSALKYEFPEMKFHSSSQKGNSDFEAGKYEDAEKHYLRAMSVDTDDINHEIVLYNIGLTHLKQNRFSLAIKDFVYLLSRIQHLNSQRLLYHLLYSLYQAGEAEKFLKYCDPLNLSTLSRDFLWEIHFMKGGMLLFSNNKAAADEYLWVWKNNKKIIAFEFALKAYYQERDFPTIIKLIENNPDARSETIFSYQIRSLLGIGRFKEALDAIEKQSLADGQFIRLRLEVWLANQMYQTIIDNVSLLMNQTLNTDDRRLFYLSLGDAHFNLRNYSESKNQFYKALSLTSDSTEKSLILYNIALTTYYSNNYQGFLKETDVILKSENLSPEVRYNLIQLLVDYYEQTQQRPKADEILEQYIQTSSFQRAKIRIKRIYLLSQAGAYDKCYKLASIPDPNETLFQQRDRIILAGHCGNRTDNSKTIIPLLEKELDQGNTYRISEMKLIIAKSHYNLGQYEQSLNQTQNLLSEKLDSKALLETRLLLVDNLIQLDRYPLAVKELGEISQYRDSEFYAKALLLSASILISKSQNEDAVKLLLRVYYLKQSEPEEKLSALIKVTEIFLDQNQMSEANKYFEQIDPKGILKYEPLYVKYVYLQSKFEKKGKSPK